MNCIVVGCCAKINYIACVLVTTYKCRPLESHRHREGVKSADKTTRNYSRQSTSLPQSELCCDLPEPDGYDLSTTSRDRHSDSLWVGNYQISWGKLVQRGERGGASSYQIKSSRNSLPYHTTDWPFCRERLKQELRSKRRRSIRQYGDWNDSPGGDQQQTATG